SFRDYLSPIYLTSPDVLHGLGLIPTKQGAWFTFEDGRGRRFRLRVASEVIDRSFQPSESWQDLSPVQATGKPPWPTALDARRESLPLYLRHPERPYWFDFQPESGLLYFQFNHADNARDGPSFREFGDSLLAFVSGHPIRDVVVDLRLNSGGNLDVARDF